MRLVTEEVLRDLGVPAPQADEMIPAFSSDPASSSSLRTFLALTKHPELLVSAGWAPETIFWSRYFWFRRFVARRIAIAGKDAGLEQQAMQILETPFPQCEPDWSKLEVVERAAISI